MLSKTFLFETFMPHTVYSS